MKAMKGDLFSRQNNWIFSSTESTIRQVIFLQYVLTEKD